MASIYKLLQTKDFFFPQTVYLFLVKVLFCVFNEHIITMNYIAEQGVCKAHLEQAGSHWLEQWLERCCFPSTASKPAVWEACAENSPGLKL